MNHLAKLYFSTNDKMFSLNRNLSFITSEITVDFKSKLLLFDSKCIALKIKTLFKEKHFIQFENILNRNGNEFTT